MFAAPAVPGQEPEAGGYLRGVEELTGQGHHAVHQVRLDEVLAYFPFARLVRRHGAVGKDEAGSAARRQVMGHVLHPGKVGVALGRRAILPSPVILETFTSPVGDVEGGIGEDVVGSQVRVPVVVEAVAVGNVALYPAKRQVHPGQLPGGVVGFLAPD